MGNPNIQLDKIDDLKAVFTKDKLLLLPFYHQLENDIKQPDRIRVQTDYFWRKWAPQLGPTLTVLIIILRSYCYYNKITKEKRDWCFPEQKTLAANIGVSVDTIQRELRRPVAQKFIRREPRYRYDPAGRRKMRTADMYFIAMDDPLTQEDEAKIAEMAADQLKSVGNPPKPQTAAYNKEPVDNSGIKPQIAAQKATAESDSRINTNKNDLITFNNKKHSGPLSGQQAALVEEIISVCGDEHSRRFYELVAKTVPSQRIWATISEVRDVAAAGRLKKSKGAYFTSLIRSHMQSYKFNPESISISLAEAHSSSNP